MKFATPESARLVRYRRDEVSTEPFIQRGIGAMKTPTTNFGPMTQQGTMGARSHEMYPQEFLRLVGCREQS